MMPNHGPTSSLKFHRSKTLPTAPTFRYESNHCDGDTSNFAATNRTNSEASPSQRITRLWTHFSLTHCLKFSCSFSFIYAMFLRAKVAKLEAVVARCSRVPGSGTLNLEDTNISDCGVDEALWLSWTFVADSGSHADRVGVGPRIVSVAISTGGMLIFATMLGLISDVISKMVDSLRKGKSEVLESNHILILGWSDKLGSLLKQLEIANKSIGGGVVVVLAERDKEEMEVDISKIEFDLMGTSVICRSGSPLILADLKKVSVSSARAIIVLGSDENADQSDARALRVVLSLTGVKEGWKGHVVVEMCDLDNEPLVKLVGGEHIETVVAHDVIGRLMIQCALQPGLAQIWEDILGFENAEFYIKKWPQLDGYRFKDVLISFPNAIPCGVKVAADGKIVLNPSDNYVLEEGDEILVIAEDDDTYAPGSLPEDPPKYPEKILFCGWRRDIDDMIKVLEALLAPGSELWMFNEGNAVIRRHLESLPLETFDSNSHWRTLLFIQTPDLLPRFSLFEIYSRNGFPTKIQSQALYEYLASPVVAGSLVSMALAMVAEDKQINRVLKELFAEKGNELCIRPAEFYIYDQEESSPQATNIQNRS
ncbi:hypothetical protein AALP_AA8G273500 [Arabis alpina]|uniref:RCK N-terminal domain-containing protein n=1 Tax=Arabis alpina TaxID=50452 RepID=A0A087G9S7_ARAAL|nr:hypothetical protein AALP_AA8G273500 [Arabis alpina]